ncbi:unnamed protein product [marine sediment metagenome]|uniref:Uncharacterized protein n=1 Tax=marine sediment metagenome TaxID=412755 RepID=X0VZ35_9ZZZZ
MLKQAFRLKKGAVVHDGIEITLRKEDGAATKTPEKTWIPIVGGVSQGKRIEFDVPPPCDVALVTHPFSFSRGRFEREKYTLCYLLTSDMEKAHDAR